MVTHWLNDRPLLVAEHPALSVTVAVTVRHCPSSCGGSVSVRVLPLPLTEPAGEKLKLYDPEPPLAVATSVTAPVQSDCGAASATATGELTVKEIDVDALHVFALLLAVTVTVCGPGANVLVDEQPLDVSVVLPSLKV